MSAISFRLARSRLQLVEPRRFPVDGGDLDAAFEQPERHRPPDAAGRSGDNRHLPP